MKMFLRSKRTLAMILLTFVVMLSLGTSAFAYGTTSIISPSGGIYATPTAVTWSAQSDVRASQLVISAYDGSFSYNSGPIYGSGIKSFQIPANIQSTIPHQKSLYVYVEDYHYSNNGSYAGYSTDRKDFYIVN